MLHLFSDVNLRLDLLAVDADDVGGVSLDVIVHQLSNSSHAAQDLSASVQNAVEDATALAQALSAELVVSVLDGIANALEDLAELVLTAEDSADGSVDNGLNKGVADDVHNVGEQGGQGVEDGEQAVTTNNVCLLYTSDAADE